MSRGSSLIRAGSGVSPTTQYLTEEFYRWEERTRGYLLWDYPVSPEPPFVPFEGHYLPSNGPVLDDTRKPTFLSSLADKIRGKFSQEEEGVETEYHEDDEYWNVTPDIYLPEGDISEFQIILPRDFPSSRKLAEQFLQTLSFAHHPISFEIIGTKTQVVIQFASRDKDTANLQTQLHAYVPSSTLAKRQNYLTSLWREHEYSLIVDFGLTHEGMLPLSSQNSFDIDPLIGIIGALSTLQGMDVGIVQVLFLPVRNSWADSLTRSVTDWDGTPFFSDAPELVKACKEKISSPLYGVLIRIGANSDNQQTAHNLVRSLGGAISQFNAPGGNALAPLNNEGYPSEIHVDDVLNRYTLRSGMLLNRTELVNLVHFPDASIQGEKLLRTLTKTKKAPELARNNELLLGINAHQGECTDVTLNSDQRMRHMYIVGASGTGKSTLLLNLIIQDIRSGQGVAVLDPHGDLIDQILDRIPKSRKNDVLLFNPADEEYPIPFNIFSAASETEKTLLASDLTGVFRRLSTSWGDQMNVVLANGILAMLESSTGGTLMTLRRFLIEKSFRKEFLKTVQDPEIAYYWEKEFPMLSGRPQASVLTRLDTFLRPKLIRHMVGQMESRVDFAEIMNSRKIFLAKLSHGGIGEENSFLLGALLVAKIHQIALSRQEINQRKRQPFYLYIDEFQNFVTPSMESILSGARKYNLGLILAHQELRQLAAKNREVASSVLSNPYTRICFRLGDADAGKLAGGFSLFDSSDLQSLGIGQAIGRIERAQYDFNLATQDIPAVSDKSSFSSKDEIITASRKSFGVPREVAMRELYPDENTEKATQEPTPEKQPEPSKPRFIEKKKRKAESEEPVSPDAPQKPTPSGRGGTQHQYLQRLIKRIGQERGYKASVEEKILGGAGLVDISLKRGEGKIACEICVSTSATHELDNIQKCLAGGYGDIVVLSHERKKLNSIRKLVNESINSSDHDNIHLLLPEEFITFLDGKDAENLKREKTVRGYKVKVNYKAATPQEQEQKKEAIAKLIVESMKKMDK